MVAEWREVCVWHLELWVCLQPGRGSHRKGAGVPEICRSNSCQNPRAKSRNTVIHLCLPSSSSFPSLQSLWFLLRENSGSFQLQHQQLVDAHEPPSPSASARQVTLAFWCLCHRHFCHGHYSCRCLFHCHFPGSTTFRFCVHSAWVFWVLLCCDKAFLWAVGVRLVVNWRGVRKGTTHSTMTLMSLSNRAIIILKELSPLWETDIKQTLIVKQIHNKDINM